MSNDNVEREFSPEYIARQEGFIKDTTTPIPGVDPQVVITFSNVADKFLNLELFYNRNGGKLPTPQQIGVDNSKIFIDGVTSYAWLMREGLRMMKGNSSAYEGKPIHGEYKDAKGMWNAMGEFTPYGQVNPNDGLRYNEDGTTTRV